MDWRSGSRQNPAGSAFRGISSRSRGRGRGRGLSRGGHTGTPHAISPSVTPSPVPPVPLPPPSPPAQATPSPPVNPSAPSKPPSRRASHQPPRTPSLSHLDTSKAPVASSTELSTTPGGHQVARRASHNFTSVPTPSITSLKLSPSTPTTPGSPRPKPPRKRSHNRTRSSSKASTTQQVSAAPSTSSLKERSKEAPPHMPLASASSDVQSFDPRTDIDTLVERVRAMAMAGSAVDKEKNREGTHTLHGGHIDWAGDDDDTLPDLDDWVKPKQAQHKEAEQAEAEQPYLPQVEEIADPRQPSDDRGTQKTSGLDRQKPEDKVEQVQDGRDAVKLKIATAVSKEADASNGRTKSRGKHNRKKSTVSEANAPPLATQTSAGSEMQSIDALGAAKSRPPLVHPLPPRPQLSAPPVRGFRSRGPVHTNQPVSRVRDNILGEVSSTVPFRDHESVKPPLTQAVKPIIEAEKMAAPSHEPKTAFDPSVDWANAPRLTETSTVESVCEVSATPSSSFGPSPDTNTRKRAFDPSVDWSKASRTPNISPARRTRSPVPSARISSPPSFIYPHTAPSRDRSRGPFPHHNMSSRSSSTRDSPQPPAQTRSHMNSPERSPHRWQDTEGPTHLRAHSSPHTGPGTRTHASRPVITVDALSIISRTLRVPGATTPPRGPAAEVAVAD